MAFSTNWAEAAAASGPDILADHPAPPPNNADDSQTLSIGLPASSSKELMVYSLDNTNPNSAVKMLEAAVLSAYKGPAQRVRGPGDPGYVDVSLFFVIPGEPDRKNNLWPDEYDATARVRVTLTAYVIRKLSSRPSSI